MNDSKSPSTATDWPKLSESLASECWSRGKKFRSVVQLAGVSVGPIALYPSPFTRGLLAVCGIGVVLFVLGWTTSEHEEATRTGEVRGELVVYGSAPGEFGELWIPAANGADGHPIIVVIHGGFWSRRAADYSIMSGLSQALFESGFAVWNIEYGRVGEVQGGWPHTLEHIAHAVDHVDTLAKDYAIDASRLGVVGHSAGGQLAIWSAGRRDLEFDDPGSNPGLIPSVVVALAPISDIERADREGLGDDAVRKLLGGHLDAVPDRYRVLGVGRASPQVQIILAADDSTVPERFAVGGFEGEPEQVRRLDGLDHFDLIAPSGDAMTAILDAFHIFQSERE